MTDFSVSQRRISLILKAVVFVSAVTGTFLSYYADRNSFMGGLSVFMYFTIQSNIGLAVISAAGGYKLLKKRPVSNTWFLVRFVGTVSITLTGMVFCFVLAPTMWSSAWSLRNVLTHVVVPVCSVADFFVTGINSRIENKSVFLVIIPPLIYAFYAAIGYVNNWQFAEGYNYPYFFLNWGSPAGAFGFSKELPFMGCVWWILALLLFLIGTGYGYLAILNRLKKKYLK